MSLFWANKLKMLSFLKNHPFAVEAFFESSLVLAFAIPKAEIEHLIPECLSLDLFEDKYAFIAVAMVQTKALRPKGLPEFMGNDFFLIGYRVFVRYTNNAGRSMRGLYILKSETDNRKMEFFGNIFTNYNYESIDIKKEVSGKRIQIESTKSNFRITVETSEDDIALPENSPFADWKQAQKFAGPLPFTFTYSPETKDVLLIEGVRQNWKPKPVKVVDYKIGFLDKMKFQNVSLANAFIIENIPYYWKKGKIERWKG